MASISERNGRLYFDFRFQGIRCREYTALPDTRSNRVRLEATLQKISAEITLGTFNYSAYFPGSARAAQFTRRQLRPASAATPSFSDFAEVWVEQKAIEWRASYQDSVRHILESHLIPAFGNRPVAEIDRDAVLSFRAALAVKADGSPRAPATVNKIVGILQTVLDEAATRYEFTNPCSNIRRLKVRKNDIHPFSLEEVGLLLDAVREDYRDYHLVRLLTGLRSGEVHGLKWRHVDFERGQLLIRETFSHGRTEYTKTDGSQRNVQMSSMVHQALAHRFSQAPENPDAYVFATASGAPVDNKNYCARVWYPLLRHLGLDKRRPYQMRHTAATLWLASGENPEWIAMQLGHTSTEMLFKTYSRYVPNLTRQDGSAFERVLANGLGVKS